MLSNRHDYAELNRPNPLLERQVQYIREALCSFDKCEPKQWKNKIKIEKSKNNFRTLKHFF